MDEKAEGLDQALRIKDSVVPNRKLMGPNPAITFASAVSFFSFFRASNRASTSGWDFVTCRVKLLFRVNELLHLVQ